MNRIKQLEEELQREKAKQGKEEWEKWRKEGEAFLQGIKGKCLVYGGTSNSATIFRVKSFKFVEVYMYKGYFQIETEGYHTIHCTSTSDNPKYRKGGIQFATDDYYGTISVSGTGRGKNKNKLVLSTFSSRLVPLEKGVCFNTARITKIGYYKVNKNGHADYSPGSHFEEFPQCSVQHEFCSFNTFEVEPELYERMDSFAKQQALAVGEFWNENEHYLQNMKRIK